MAIGISLLKSLHRGQFDLLCPFTNFTLPIIPPHRGIWFSPLKEYVRDHVVSVFLIEKFLFLILLELRTDRKDVSSSPPHPLNVVSEESFKLWGYFFSFFLLRLSMALSLRPLPVMAMLAYESCLKSFLLLPTSWFWSNKKFFPFLSCKFIGDLVVFDLRKTFPKVHCLLHWLQWF